jgi:hypothetical protein
LHFLNIFILKEKKKKKNNNNLHIIKEEIKIERKLMIKDRILIEKLLSANFVYELV